MVQKDLHELYLFRVGYGVDFALSTESFSVLQKKQTYVYVKNYDK